MGDFHVVLHTTLGVSRCFSRATSGEEMLRGWMQVPQSIPTLVRYSLPLCKIASEERVMLLKMHWKTRKEMNTQQTFHEPTYASSSPRVKEDLLTDVVSGNWTLLVAVPSAAYLLCSLQLGCIPSEDQLDFVPRPISASCASDFDCILLITYYIRQCNTVK